MRKLLAIFTLLLTSCADDSPLIDKEAAGELVMVTRNGPTTYYIGQEGASGLDYDLAKNFAASIGLKLQVKLVANIDEVLSILERGEAHFAAAGLIRTNTRDKKFLSTNSYLTQRPLVIYKPGERRPRSIKDFSNFRLIALLGSHHIQTLQDLKQSLPTLRWREINAGNSLALLKILMSDEADIALIDSEEFLLQQRLYPRIGTAFSYADEIDTVWYFPRDKKGKHWQKKANEFISQITANGELERLTQLHFGGVRHATRIGSFTFQRKMQKLLPQWQELIESTAREFRLDWRLLAAIAYQESHLDPEAKSPTGVRGMMMLTQSTANDLGVTDRTDPSQSLRGGAKFLKSLRRRLPADIEEPHRTWMALAAYNIGMGHLEDARVLTEKTGENPHIWEDVRKNLHKLQQPIHYEKTRYGFARGAEAVTYVDNIRHYFTVLKLQNLGDSFLAPNTLLDGPSEGLPKAVPRSPRRL